MPNFKSGSVGGQGAFESQATPRHAIGERKEGPDGRIFRYVLCGATALVVGNALQSPIEDVDHDNLAVRVTAAGATALLMTTGASGGALDVNEYEGGYAVIHVTPGLGYTYRIHDHLAIAASTDGAINLFPEDAIQVALTASSKVTLVSSPYRKVIQFPVTTASGICVGGAIYPVVAAEYGWIQTWGIGAALIAGTPAVGQPVTPVGAVAGALTVQSAELPPVALMASTGINTGVCPVYWRAGA